VLSVIEMGQPGDGQKKNYRCHREYRQDDRFPDKIVPQV
jgi:hypothetical protein